MESKRLKPSPSGSINKQNFISLKSDDIPLKIKITHSNSA